MKKSAIFYLLPLALLIAVTSCKKSFNDLYKNPNKPTSSPAYLLLTGILNDMYDAPSTMDERWAQYYCCNYDYYGNNRYDFGEGKSYYGTLKNVVKMEEEAKNSGMPDVNAYEALAKFFKAYFFSKMSLEMGDIPMTQALQGSENLTPVYDKQKDVFKQCLLWLDSANNDIATVITNGGSDLQGDFYFNNNLSNWQKVVNTFRLRLLISLSKKVNDGDLQVAKQFSDIISNPTKYPIMQGMSDNLLYVYVYPTNTYPNNRSNFGFDALRYNTSATYIGLLTKFHDPRVFVTAEPAQAVINDSAHHVAPTDFAAFVGADPGEDLGDMYSEANNGQYSLLNRKRYYSGYTGENCIQIGYPEMCFNIAEAINRGWIASGPLGDAEAYYKAGIEASRSFYDIPESGDMNVYFLHYGPSGTNLDVYDNYTVTVNFDNYYSQDSVKYAGNNATGLWEILTQRYLALFRHSGLESYFTYRRTGIPHFTTGPGTGNSGRIAKRFTYPKTELSANTQNYQQALQGQYGGTDDINGTMWILQ